MNTSAPPPQPATSAAPPNTSPSIIPSLPLSQPPPLPPPPPAPALPDSSCPHLGPVLANISDIYTQTVTWASHIGVRRLAQSASEPPPGKRRRIQHPSCLKCGLATPSPWVCLECSLAACWSGSSSHVLAHLRESGHGFVVEARSGAVWCNKCETIVLSRKLDNLHLLAQRSAEELATIYHVDGRKRRQPFNQVSASQLPVTGELVACSSRRGLLNLGNTCYLNSVLQSLLANPLIRNNFLADRHNAKACGGGVCIPCEMDKLFAEAYDQSSESPLAPASMLQSLWQISREVNGYGQHDAHEAFIAIVNAMHLHSRGSVANSSACQCVIHTLFDGQLASEVHCSNCNRGSRTVDPLMDISLSLDSSCNTLDACLRRYTRVEKLDARTCGDCNTFAEATKQLSIRRLPAVLYVQFKRFEQRGLEKMHKIEAPIRFPSVLDMRPYVTRREATIDDETTSVLNTGPRKMYEYDLFAVICHEGSLETGHYVAFTRSSDEWYKFDDEKVTHATLRDALSPHTQVYMLCYVKRRVEYRPIDPRSSQQRAREADMEEQRRREKEREQRDKLEIERQLLELA